MKTFQTMKQDMLTRVEIYVNTLLSGHLSEHMYFHNLSHTKDVVTAASFLGESIGVDKKTMEILLIAAWFHDTGYTVCYRGHEQESARLARAFLLSHRYDGPSIEQVVSCIMATRLPQSPGDLASQVLCDADLFHISDMRYFDYENRLRKEWAQMLGKSFTDGQWNGDNIDFFEGHHYFTSPAQTRWTEGKNRNLMILKAGLNG